MEPGDGEMTIPPVLQPVTEIFSPIKTMLAVPPLMEDTWALTSIIAANGALANQTFLFPTFAKGRWDIDVSLTVQFSSGVSYPFSEIGLRLSDPSGNQQSMMAFAAYSFVSVSVVKTLRMHFLESGWQFIHVSAATLVNEQLTSFASVYARRVF